jgi:hypothetical protein
LGKGQATEVSEGADRQRGKRRVQPNFTCALALVLQGRSETLCFSIGTFWPNGSPTAFYSMSKLAIELEWGLLDIYSSLFKVAQMLFFPGGLKISSLRSSTVTAVREFPKVTIPSHKDCTPSARSTAFAEPPIYCLIRSFLRSPGNKPQSRKNGILEGWRRNHTKSVRRGHLGKPIPPAVYSKQRRAPPYH